MTITETRTVKSGVTYIVEYHDADNFDDLDKSKCTQSYGVCFCGDKMVIGFGGKKKDWGLIGGTIEPGETFEGTLVREIQEESNMKILKSKPVGYQKCTDTRDNSFIFQLRYVCIVEPYGPFVSDPAGGVTEIKLIDEKDYKQYFKWGKIVERIISRAVELVKSL